MTRARTTRAGLTSYSKLTLTAVLAAGLVLGVSGAEAAKSKDGAANADHLIKTGVDALRAGRVDLAVQELTAAITGGKISQSTLARALYYRGLAYRKQNKPAQAIADFTSALWIKNGLDAEQRADALLNRAAAYREAGLTDQAEADEKRVAATRQAAGANTASAESRPTPSTSPAASSAPSSSSGGLGSFFSALFGNAPASQEAPAQGSSAPSNSASGTRQATGAGRSPTVSAWSSQTHPATGGWSDTTVVRKASTSDSSRRTPTTTASTGRSAGVGQFVQVAAVRSRQEAQAVAARLKQLGVTEGQRDTAIEEAVMGNMGTLYSVRLGPFASANEVQSICPRLRQAGLDCLIISR
jgi:tetratricopeptide (TPR) repeat protein